MAWSIRLNHTNTPVQRPACTVHMGSEPLHITTPSTSLVKKDPLDILSRIYFSQNPPSSKLEATQRINVGLAVKVKVFNCQIPRVRPFNRSRPRGNRGRTIHIPGSCFMCPGFKSRSRGQFSSRRWKGSTYLSTVVDDGHLTFTIF